MRPYLRPATTMNQFMLIWSLRVFHHVLQKYGHETHENAEMQTRKFDTCVELYIFVVQVQAMLTQCSSLNIRRTEYIHCTIVEKHLALKWNALCSIQNELQLF